MRRDGREPAARGPFREPAVVLCTVPRRDVRGRRIIKKLPRAKGFASISYPGENKAKRFSKNSKKKIYLPKEIEKDLEKLISASS